MVDSLEKTLVEGIGNKFLLVGIFGLAKREKFDHLDACMSIHRTKLSMLNQVK